MLLRLVVAAALAARGASWSVKDALVAHDAADAAAHAAASLTRDPRVSATCDVRGNLGPCSVVVQETPGNDWLRDRWQAASDMGGTAIKRAARRPAAAAGSGTAPSVAGASTRAGQESEIPNFKAS